METDNQTARALPRYRCTKEVGALKIHKVVYDAALAQREGRGTDGSATLYPAEKGYEPIVVQKNWVDIYEPKPGMYYVVLSNGHAVLWSSVELDGNYVPVEAEE